MRISKDQIPAKINVPGAVARVATDFGDATGFGTMGGEYFSLGAGTDIAPLLKGLKDDACHAPHWGYMISGELVVTYIDGKVDTCKENDLFTGLLGTACARSKTPRSSFQPAVRTRSCNGSHAEFNEGYRSNLEVSVALS